MVSQNHHLQLSFVEQSTPHRWLICVDGQVKPAHVVNTYDVFEIQLIFCRIQASLHINVIDH